jgi:ribosomal protein L13E
MRRQEPFQKAKHPMLRMGRKDKVRESAPNRVDVVDGSQTFIAMTTWQKRDWQQFYELARRPWRRHRPPRPVYPSGLNRVAPAQGYSLSELDDAGVDLDLAEALGLPVDAGRIGVYGPNVTVLREFIRSSRQPL